MLIIKWTLVLEIKSIVKEMAKTLFLKNKVTLYKNYWIKIISKLKL